MNLLNPNYEPKAVNYNLLTASKHPGLLIPQSRQLRWRDTYMNDLQGPHISKDPTMLRISKTASTRHTICQG